MPHDPNFGDVFVTSFQQAQNRTLERRAQKAAQRLRRRQLAERIRARQQQGRQQRAQRLQQQQQFEQRQEATQRRIDLQAEQLETARDRLGLEREQQEPIEVPIPEGVQDQYGGRERITIDPRAVGAQSQILAAQLYSQRGRGGTTDLDEEMRRDVLGAVNELRKLDPVSVGAFQQGITQPEDISESEGFPEDRAQREGLQPPAESRSPARAAVRSILGEGSQFGVSADSDNIISAAIRGLTSDEQVDREEALQSLRRRRTAGRAAVSQAAEQVNQVQKLLDERGSMATQQALRQSPSTVQNMLFLWQATQGTEGREAIENELESTIRRATGKSPRDLIQRGRAFLDLNQRLQEGSIQDAPSARDRLESMAGDPFVQAGASVAQALQEANN